MYKVASKDGVTRVWQDDIELKNVVSATITFEYMRTSLTLELQDVTVEAEVPEKDVRKSIKCIK